jgi:hypothetical protein
MGGVSSVLTKMGDNGVEKVFYGQHIDFYDGIGVALVAGAGVGFAATVGADKASKYGPGALRTLRSFTPWKGLPGPPTGSFKLITNSANAIEIGRFGGALAGEAAFGAIKPSVTLGFWQLKDHVLTPYVLPVVLDAKRKARDSIS